MFQFIFLVFLAPFGALSIHQPFTTFIIYLLSVNHVFKMRTIVCRRSHAVLQSTLPQKEEYVLLIRMTPLQRKLYDRFMNEVVRSTSVPNPLKAFAICCKVRLLFKSNKIGNIYLFPYLNLENQQYNKTNA